MKEQDQKQGNGNNEQDLPINDNQLNDNHENVIQINENQLNDSQIEANIDPSPSEPPAKRQRIDAEQVINDLDLENIDFDAYDFDEPTNVR